MKIIPLFFLSCLFLNSYAQVDPSSALYKIIREKDSLLFTVGFNTCDIQQFEHVLSEQFEFYHDQVGVTDSKDAFILSVKNGLCALTYKPMRVLAENSMEVYPLENDGVLYGAIQQGVHDFYAIESDGKEYLSGTAKFTHVWTLENGDWKLRRGLSYDHKDFEKPFDETLLFHDKAETERWLKQRHIPAVGIGFINNSKIEQVSVFGELEPGIAAPQNTIWNVASLTKPVTALVALKLIDAGKLELDEPLFKYYVDPDIAADTNTKKLTARIILSHQTGLPNWRGDNADGKLAFAFEPGTQYQYSGEGYDYLRKALEKKFRKTIDQLAAELVFKPLKMDSTSYVWSKKIDKTKVARWHTSEGDLYPIQTFSVPSGADNLLTTVEDYCKFMLYVMNGAGLSQPLYQEMIKGQVKINDYKDFGLGWWMDKDINANHAIALVHGGDDIGVHTIAFIVPSTQQALLIFTNSDNGTEAKGKGILGVEMK